MGYLYSDRPLDAACFGVVLAFLLNARGFTCVACVSRIFSILGACLALFAVL